MIPPQRTRLLSALVVPRIPDKEYLEIRSRLRNLDSQDIRHIVGFG